MPAPNEGIHNDVERVKKLTLLTRYLNEIEFADPGWLFLLILLPILAGWRVSRGKGLSASLLVSSLKGFQNTPSWKRALRGLLPVLRLFAITCLILAMARPQSHRDEKRAEGDGIDIVLCLDVSGSMLAQDFLPSRLEAAKEVAAEFVMNRPTDRFGIVVFAGESFTQCPVTSDHDVVREQIYGVKGGFMADGTSIGSGLASSLDRLRNSASKSRVVILLTDGENNGGLIDPVTARKMAVSLGIKVYTIGIGSEGFAPTPVQSPTGGIIMQQEKVNIDEDLLRGIANETGAKYFRVRDQEGLRVVYNEIDQMEKTRIDIVSSRLSTERFQPFAIAAMIFILLEMIAAFTFFRKFP
jgi:Ca-activated chloride channel family protein